jgi:hypothetical protein
MSMFLTIGNTADGEFDAAEIDKELISARLKQDVLEHSGKVHLYVANSVSHFYLFLTYTYSFWTISV